LFADNKNSAFEFTPAGDGVSEEEEDYIFPDKYMCLGEISGGNCVSPEYQLDLDYHGEDVLPLPVVLFYENGTGNFKAFVDDNGDYLPISKHDYRQLVFRFSETDGDQLEKYLVIFQVSGLPEEIKNEADILN